MPSVLAEIRRIIYPAVALMAVSLLPNVSEAAERYTIDSARTIVSFEVRSLGVFRQHGWFGTAFGSVSLDPRAGEGRFEVVIDARSIQAGNDAVLRVMRGPGFLDIEKFPEIAYKAAHMIFSDDQPIRIEGELTLLGATHPVPLRVSGYHCSPATGWNLRRCMMDATAIFKRSEFGMTGSLPFAGDRVRLAIHAETTADPIDENEQGREHTAEVPQ